MGDVKTDIQKTSAPRDSQRPKTAISITRKIVISSDSQVVATSPRSPSSPRSGTSIPIMKETDLDNLDLESMKSVVPAILYSRDKMLEQSKEKGTINPEFVKLRRERLTKAEEDLQKKIEASKILLTQRVERKEKYCQLLNRLGLTWEEIPKIENVINDVEKEAQMKHEQVNSIKKKFSDLETSLQAKINAVDKQCQDKIQEINSCLEAHKELIDKLQAKEKSMFIQNQQCEAEETEIRNQLQHKQKLEQEIQILEGELENKTKAFRTLEQSIEKATKDINNLEHERESLTAAQTSLFVEKDNLGKNATTKTLGLGAAAIFGVAAFTGSVLFSKK